MPLSGDVDIVKGTLVNQRLDALLAVQFFRVLEPPLDGQPLLIWQ
jgi:hypothetical protein